MYRSVHEVLRANDTIWGGIPAFVSTMNTFEENLQLLETNELKQRSATQGVRSAKDELKGERIGLLIRIASALTAYANSTGDVVLRAKVKTSAAILLRSGQVDFISYFDSLIESATEHQQELIDYGISITEINELNAYRDQMRDSFLSTRLTIIDRSMSTKAIKELSREMDTLLIGRIDKLMKTLQTEHEDFFFLYSKARKSNG